MRLWYRDLLQKVVLATLAGTLTFSFSLLRHVEDTSVPDIGVTLAGVLVTVSLLLLLVYLNRFTHSLRPVAVAATVADAGRRVFQGLPAPEAAALGAGGDGGPGDRPAGPATVVRTARAGAIQAIDVRGLLALARGHDNVLVLLHSVGDFVPTGASLVQVYGPAPSTVQRRVRRMFALGLERTIEQDPAFALRILVDIAIRALSPAVNDPTTAVQVLNYIEDLLLVIGRREARGDGELRDPDGRLRLVVPVRHFEQYLDLGMTEIRQYGARWSRRPGGSGPCWRSCGPRCCRSAGPPWTPSCAGSRRASRPASPTATTGRWPARATARASAAQPGHAPAEPAASSHREDAAARPPTLAR